MLRRILFAALLVFSGDYPYIQLMLSIIVTMLVICYILVTRPFEEALLNKMEFFNELSVLIASYIILLFSPFLDDYNLIYKMGWLMIGIVSFNLIVNMLVILNNTF